MDLKQVWEKKINETKAVDNNAREPEPVTTTKGSNRANNSTAGSHSSRNSNKEQTTQQSQQQSQQTQQQVSQHMNQVSSPQLQSSANHPVSGGMPQVHLQSGANILLGPSGINYTTNSEPVFDLKF